MLVHVDRALRIARHEMRPRVLSSLTKALSFRPSNKEPSLCLLEETPSGWILPRGSIHALRSITKHEGIKLEFVDHRVDPGATLSPLPELSLRGYQQRAVEQFLACTQGTIVVPCGGGKTRIGLGVLTKLARPALILVHTLDLATQWQEELRSHLGIDAGFIGDGDERIASITVALPQALSRWNAAKLDAFLQCFGLVILDEAHHVAASMFRAVVHRCPARFRLGLTATPEREDGLTALLELYLGRTIFQIHHTSLIAFGVLSVPEIQRIETAFEFAYRDTEDYGELLSTLASDEDRNELIASHIARDAAEGHTCLVLSGRIDHCERLREKLEERHVRVALLTGRVSKERRRMLLDEARAGTLPVLIATSLADEGLDLPRLSRVYLSFPGRARGRTMQRLGRLMRPHPEKRGAALVDFVDRRVPILRKHHLERRRLFAELLGAEAIRPLTTISDRSER